MDTHVNRARSPPAIAKVAAKAKKDLIIRLWIIESLVRSSGPEDAADEIITLSTSNPRPHILPTAVSREHHDGCE